MGTRFGWGCWGEGLCVCGCGGRGEGQRFETPEFVTRNIEPHDISTEDRESLVTSQCLRLTNLTD